MSISSEIITQKSEGVLVVSNEALKSKNDVYRVQKVNEKIFSKNLENVMLKEIPRSVVVVIGLEGNENTEIKTGLQEGDFVVLKSSKTATVAAKTNSLFSMFGGSKNGSTGRAGGSPMMPR